MPESFHVDAAITAGATEPPPALLGQQAGHLASFKYSVIRSSVSVWFIYRCCCYFFRCVVRDVVSHHLLIAA